MRIFINILFINLESDIYAIEVTDQTSLNQAKQLLLEQSYIYPEEQVWFCNNTTIINSNISWDIKNQYSVIVNNIWLNFKIKTMIGTIIEVNHLTSRDKVSIMKYHIFEKSNLHPKNYQLIYTKNNKNITLHDETPLGKYFIPNNSTINLIIKLNTGFN